MDKFKFCNNICSLILQPHYVLYVNSKEGKMIGTDTSKISDSDFLELSLFVDSYEINLWISFITEPMKVDVAIREKFNGNVKNYIESNEYLMSYSFNEDINDVLNRWNQIQFSNTYTDSILNMIKSVIDNTFTAYRNS